MSAAPGRAIDCTEAFREGVAQFCEQHKKEIATMLRDELRIDLAELIAVRTVPKEGSDVHS